MIERPFLIILNEPSPTQREAAHRLIKEMSTQWWHHFPDVWIVGGHTASDWRDLLSKEVAGKLLVLALPDTLPRSWASSWTEQPNSSDSLGPFAWLTHVYSGKSLDEADTRMLPAPEEDDGYSDEPPF